MPSLDRRPRRIDKELPATGGGAIIGGGGGGSAGAPPGVAVPGAPQGLRILNTFLIYSAVTPAAGANLAWSAPVASQEPDGYVVQWATDAGFTSPQTRQTSRGQLTAGLDGLPTGTTIYVRVAARIAGVESAWSNTASATTPQDTTAPAAPTSLITAWDGSTGDLRITWTNPASTNLRDVRVRVYASNGGTLLTEDYSPNGSYTWTRAQNLIATSNSPDASVYLVLTARSWGGVFSTTDLTGTATLAVPANVSGASATWDGQLGTCRFAWTATAAVAGYRLTIDGVARTVVGTEYVYTLAQNRQEHSGTADPALTWSLVAVDALGQVSATPASGTATLAAPATPAGTSHNWLTGADIAGEDWTLTWTQGTGITGYRLTIDGVARDLPLSSRYHYPFLQNAQEHSGTADPALTWSLVAVDALGQVSVTPASGTATNAAPPAPTSVTLTQTFSGFLAEVAATRPADLLAYRFRIIQTSPSASDVTLDEPAPFLARVATTPATYQVGVRQVDRFNQAGAETLSATLLVDALTLALLRERLVYTDSAGTAAATLKTAMSDDVRGSGGISYTSNAGWARWVRADWGLRERIRTITLAIAPASGTTTWYLRTSTDGTTWSYFSGPLVATGATGQSTTLTAQASEANAQSNAVSSASLGSSGAPRVDLPTLQEARYVELWLRNTGASSRVDEFFPRRFVQTDDLEAESIRAFHISAGAVTADKLTIPGTASIDSSLRLIAFRVPVSLDLDSGIYQGTGTFASPTTGLKLWNSGGVGRLATYNAGVVQVELNTSGQLAWGGGVGLADANGMRITTGSAFSGVRGYNFTSSLGGTAPSTYGLHAYSLSGRNYARVGVVGPNTSAPATLEIRAVSTTDSRIEIVTGRPDIGSPELAGLIISYQDNANIYGTGVDISVNQSLAVRDAGSLWVQGGASIGYSTGGLNVGSATGATGGQIFASGIVLSNQSMAFRDRTTTTRIWEWYGLSNIARLYNGTSADALTITPTGDLSFGGYLSFGATVAPAAPAAGGRLWVDSTTGDLTIIFANGTVKVIATN